MCGAIGYWYCELYGILCVMFVGAYSMLYVYGRSARSQVCVKAAILVETKVEMCVSLLNIGQIYASPLWRRTI